MKGNLLVVHGGGPTAVLNCSLFGVVRQAIDSHQFGRVLGARGGIGGAVREQFIDLRAQSRRTMDQLRHTPGSALGSCRRTLSEEEEERLFEVLRRNEIHCLLYNGGNGSMASARRMHNRAIDLRYELQVVGIPKTIDNDLSGTDRCPGYASAARYVAQSVRDLGTDVHSLSVPVSIFEAMGRNAGWLGAASALARTGPDSAPHLIYLPEAPFSMERFLSDVQKVFQRLGWVVAVVSEGLCDRQGGPTRKRPAAASQTTFGSPPPGDIAAYLAQSVTSELGLRARSEKPGLCGRSSILHASRIDQLDAETVGRAAVTAALNDQGGHMVGLLEYHPDAPSPQTVLVPLEQVVGERTMPPCWLDPTHAFVTPAFCQWLNRLIQPELLSYTRLT